MKREGGLWLVVRIRDMFLINNHDEISWVKNKIECSSSFFFGVFVDIGSGKGGLESPRGMRRYNLKPKYLGGRLAHGQERPQSFSTFQIFKWV